MLRLQAAVRDVEGSVRAHAVPSGEGVEGGQAAGGGRGELEGEEEMATEDGGGGFGGGGGGGVRVRRMCAGVCDEAGAGWA